MTHKAEIDAARAVLGAHIEALNNRNTVALAETLHFPHFRLSGAKLKVWPDSRAYFSDFQARAGKNWAWSRFDDIRVLQASNDKVHLDLEVNRFDAQDCNITSFRSLWVITLEQGRWAAKFRSSFASK